MKKSLVLGCFIIMLAIAISGCGNNTSTDSLGNSEANNENNKDDKILLNFGTTKASSGVYPYHISISSSINELSNEELDNQIKVTPVETSGVEDNFNRLLKGEVQFAASAGTTDYQLMEGLGTFKDNANKDIRNLLVWQESTIVPVVRMDSGVESMADLDGKPLSAGATGSSAYALTSAALDVVSINPEYHQGGASE